MKHAIAAVNQQGCGSILKPSRRSFVAWEQLKAWHGMAWHAVAVSVSYRVRARARVRAYERSMVWHALGCDGAW